MADLTECNSDTEKSTQSASDIDNIWGEDEGGTSDSGNEIESSKTGPQPYRFEPEAAVYE